jgi:ATP-dependent Clp protease protease subunit
VLFRSRLNEIYANHSGQPLSSIEEAMERDKFLTPEEAMQFGLIDSVVERHELPEDGDDDKSDGGKSD